MDLELGESFGLSIQTWQSAFKWLFQPQDWIRHPRMRTWGGMGGLAMETTRGSQCVWGRAQDSIVLATSITSKLKAYLKLQKLEKNTGIYIMVTNSH